MYIASGSAAREPSSNATDGEVGVSSRSKSSNAAAKSPAISVRTRWALP